MTEKKLLSLCRTYFYVRSIEFVCMEYSAQLHLLEAVRPHKS